MLDHPHLEARTYAATHMHTDTTKRKREGRQNISASHYIVERRGRRRPIGGFRGLEAICPPLCCYLFICPPVIYGGPYVWIRIHISRSGHKNTSESRYVGYY